MHIFYDISLQTFFDVFDQAQIDVDRTLSVEMLDCSKSYSRIQSDLEVEEILEIANVINPSNTHPVFIKRNMNFLNNVEDYLEIGLSIVFNGLTYFIFCFLPIDRLEFYTEMYDLKVIN